MDRANGSAMRTFFYAPRRVEKDRNGVERFPKQWSTRTPPHRSARCAHANAYKLSIDYLGVSLAEELEQLPGVAQCGNGVPFIRRPKCIFKPVGDTWICKNLFESHTLS